MQLYKRGTIYSCTKEVLYTVVQKKYYIQLYKRGTIYSCTKEVLYTVVQKRYYMQLYKRGTVSTDVPSHLKHFKVGGAGCQFPLLQSSPLAGLSHSLPLACLPLSHRSPLPYLPPLSSLHSPRFPPASVHDRSALSPLFALSWSLS